MINLSRVKTVNLKKEIIFLTPSSSLPILKTSPYLATLTSLAKEHRSFTFVNSDQLELPSRKGTLKMVGKEFKYFNPSSFSEFNTFLKNKEDIIIINNLSRTFSFFKLLIFLRIKNYPQILISNLGNIQDNVFNYFEINITYLKRLLTINLPDKICWLLSVLGIFKKIEARFVSNKNIYNHYNKKSKFRKNFFSYYKRIILVRSNFFEIYNNKSNKISNDFIVLLDYYPYYGELYNLHAKDVADHYLKLNKLLNTLQKIFKKKIAICIHPNYPIKFHKKVFPRYAVHKHMTNFFIKKAFLVLFFDSSSILHAIFLNKRILSIRSELLQGANRNYADTYTNIINNESINLMHEYKINKKKFLSKLNNKIKEYKKYKSRFMGSDVIENSAETISRFIKKL